MDWRALEFSIHTGYSPIVTLVQARSNAAYRPVFNPVSGWPVDRHDAPTLYFCFFRGAIPFDNVFFYN
jgi:hypothetical protein